MQNLHGSGDFARRYVNEGLWPRQTRRAMAAAMRFNVRIGVPFPPTMPGRRQINRIACSMNTAAPLHERVRAVTERIRTRSAGSRKEYLDRTTDARSAQATRTTLSCTNLAHGFAAMDAADKQALRGARWPNL